MVADEIGERGKQLEDMTIPVFYDPTNPDKNVTPCATYLKIVTDL